MNVLRKKVLISLHGIKTRGVWQKDLCPLVSEKGWKYYPLDYGNFWASELFLWLTHSKKVEWLRSELSRIQDGNPEVRPSIIVHSFGSLVLAKCLLKHTDFKFDKVILTGSIIPTAYDWELVLGRGQVNQILNITAEKDFWSKVANKFVVGAGDSGVSGFDLKNNDQLSEVAYSNFGHSDAHYKEVYLQHVLPFLERVDEGYDPGATENYVTYTSPIQAGCWTVVTYVRQFVDRFQDAVRESHFYDRETGKPLDVILPEKLVVLIPDTPGDASKNGREMLIRKLNLKPIAFGSKQERTALMATDGTLYDLPSAIDSFTVYSESSEGASAADEALTTFAQILSSVADNDQGTLDAPVEVKKLQDIIN